MSLRVRTGRDRSIKLLLAGDIDWTIFIRTVLAQGVSPLVVDRLVRAPAGSIPDDLRAALSGHLRDNRARNAALAQSLAELLDALRARGVDELLYKGQTLPVLATGDYAMRRAGDLDVLVRRRISTKRGPPVVRCAKQLLQECTSLPQPLDDTRLLRWMRGLECLELPMSSLDEAVEIVRRHCIG